MAVHTCTLKVTGSTVSSTWSKNAHKMAVGDSVKYVSEYGDVRLEFGEDCPFLPEKIKTVVAFFVKGKTPVTLKVKRLARGKRYHFLCLPGSAGLWDAKNASSGGDVPPSKPPGT